MNVIVDTSVLLAIALNEPEKEAVIRLTRGYKTLYPEIVPYEIGNALSAMLKRKRLTVSEALSAEKIANRLVRNCLPVDIPAALKLAGQFNIYAYDAYFVQTAIHYNCPLMTLDKPMKRVAKLLEITLLED